MSIFITVFAFGCSSLKEKGDEELIKKKTPNPNIAERIKSREGIGIFNSARRSIGGTNYEFATSNVMWRASLDVLNFMPLQSVSYSGGLIVTDWYEKNNEAIKIEINFKSNELSTTALEVKSFKRTCDSIKNCSIINTNSDFNENIKTKILNKARELSLKDLKNKEK